MQWLIDLVIKTIGIPPCYVSRGDYSGADYDHTTLIADSAFHELDLSAIVPEGATAVKLHCKMTSAIVATKLRLRPGGYIHSGFHCTLRSQVANVTVGALITVGLSTDRKIGYQYTTGVPGVRSITVQGWWF